jgi:UDP-glucose 4-epimerase
MVVPTFVQRALAGAPLEIHGDGEQTRCFCHVSDTIRALAGLMRHGASGEIYNVGSEQRISINALAERVRELTESTSGVEYVAYEDVYGIGIEDMLHRSPSTAKIRAAIDWSPERTLDDILGDVLAFERGKAETTASAA